MYLQINCIARIGARIVCPKNYRPNELHGLQPQLLHKTAFHPNLRVVPCVNASKPMWLHSYGILLTAHWSELTGSLLCPIDRKDSVFSPQVDKLCPRCTDLSLGLFIPSWAQVWTPDGVHVVCGDWLDQQRRTGCVQHDPAAAPTAVT